VAKPPLVNATPFTVVKVPAAGTIDPITVLSIQPPRILAELATMFQFQLIEAVTVQALFLISNTLSVSVPVPHFNDTAQFVTLVSISAEGRETL